MSAETRVFYEFGKFRCDPGNICSYARAKRFRCRRNRFEILVALIRSNGRLMMKDELIQQVWPDSFVEDANLTVNISALRKVLGVKLRTVRPYIETVPKRGYRFVAPVAERPDAGSRDKRGQPFKSRLAFRPAFPSSLLARR